MIIVTGEFYLLGNFPLSFLKIDIQGVFYRDTILH